uniref:Uncharacterized protein n=1 Tax=Arundo donax TaxID=35708 RepID=A0A0A9F282_ARUDO
MSSAGFIPRLPFQTSKLISQILSHFMPHGSVTSKSNCYEP